MGLGEGAIAEVSVSPGIRHRKRALVVIPIMAALLLALLLVPVYFCESPHREVMRKAGREEKVKQNRLPVSLSGLTTKSPPLYFFLSREVAQGKLQGRSPLGTGSELGKLQRRWTHWCFYGSKTDSGSALWPVG